VTNKQDIRYLNLPIEESVMDVKTTLFNLDNCRERNVVVVEGTFDAMRFGDNCCATLGTTVTEPQIRLLKDYRKVYIMFDNDEAGHLKAKGFAERVACMGVDVEIVDHGMDHDLGDATKDEVDYLRKELGFENI
jgi:DNA primase